MASTEIHAIGVEILKLLWCHLQEMPGLPRKKIVSYLAQLKEEGAIAPEAGISDGNVRQWLRVLRKHDPPLIRAVSPQGAHGKQYYAINRDKVITWSSTAYFVLEICKREEQAVEENTFVEQMLAQRIIDKTTQRPFVEADLKKQLKFAKDNQYLDYINQDRLIPDSRTTVEFPYLEFLASKIGRTEAASTRS